MVPITQLANYLVSPPTLQVWVMQDVSHQQYGLIEASQEPASCGLDRFWHEVADFGLAVKIIPRGSIYNTILELGPQNRNKDGFWGPVSIILNIYGP